MKVFVKGQPAPVDLDNNSFLASGGEAQIFSRGKTAYKIYHDPKKSLSVSKIQELSEITSHNIIKPIDILIDKNNKPVGYTMQYIKDTYSLCQLFTKSFKSRNSVTRDMIIDIVKIMQKGISHIHSKGILIVDLNELNFLVSKNFDNVYFIDVDSYATKNFPATALMESIRDRHSIVFSELTDWFSYAVVSFQLFIGIHPFKGTHPSIKDLDDRMIKNISVFNHHVSIPKICESFSVIPDVYKAWYKSVFEDGKRSIPPSLDGAVIIVPITVLKSVTGSSVFNVSEIENYSDDILYFGSVEGIDYTITKKGLYSHGILDDKVKTGSHLSITPRMNHLISCSANNGMLELYNVSRGVKIDASIACESLMGYKGRVYVKNDLDIFELTFVEMPSNTFVSAVHVGNVMPQATKLMDGVVLQDLLGSWYASVFPSSKSCYQIRLKEFDGYQLVDAKFDSGVLMVIGVKKGQYDRFIYRLSKDYTSYDLRIVDKITYSGLNFVVLDNGICASINEDEKLELFSADKNSNAIKVVEDSMISGDIRLFKRGTQTLFSSGGKLFTISMK